MKAIILTHGRCGSSLLLHSLSQHSCVKSNIISEPVSHYINSKLNTDILSFIYDCFIYEDIVKIGLGNISKFGIILDYINYNKDIKIIFLTRINFVDFYLSLVIHTLNYGFKYGDYSFLLKNRKQFINDHNIKFDREGKIIIDKDSLINHLKLYVFLQYYYRVYFRKRMHIVYYEDLIENWDFEMENIQYYCGLHIEKLEKTLPKSINHSSFWYYSLNKINKKECVSNYKEIVCWTQDYFNRWAANWNRLVL